MGLLNETPLLPVCSKNGGSVMQKVTTASDYRNPPLSATDLNISIIARRFGLPISTARVVCELAGIGGAA